MKSLHPIVAFTLAGIAAFASSIPGVAHAEVVSGVESIPTGHVPKLMSSLFDKRPARIGAGEKVSGLKVDVQAQGRRGRMGDITSVQINDDAERSCFRSSDGSEFTRSKGSHAPETTALRPFFEDSLHMMATEWSHDGESMVPAHVNLARRERLVLDGPETASLELTDFWFDPVTRGARKIAQANVPLKSIGKGLGDSKIYAMRDGDEFVIVLARAKGDSADGILSDEDRFSTRCGHATISLTTGESGSNMVTMDEMVAVRTDETPVKPVKAESGEGPSVLGKFMKAGGRAQLLAMPSENLNDNAVERVSRTFRISVGISQFGADKNPVVSVSRGFVGGAVGAPFSSVD